MLKSALAGTLMATVVLAMTGAASADDTPDEWKRVLVCLGKVGFVNEVHYKLRATIEWVSGDFDALNAAFKTCRDQVVKEMTAEKAGPSKKK